LRLELRGSGLRSGALLVLALLAGIALTQSALPVHYSLVLYGTALLLGWRELRRGFPLRLRCTEAGVVQLDWPDGREETLQLRGERRLGGLTVLQLEGARRTWLELWPDSLSTADRKALRRRLRGGTPLAPSV
jgi:hypothetical protein